MQCHATIKWQGVADEKAIEHLVLLTIELLPSSEHCHSLMTFGGDSSLLSCAKSTSISFAISTVEKMSSQTRNPNSHWDEIPHSHSTAPFSIQFGPMCVIPKGNKIYAFILCVNIRQTSYLKGSMLASIRPGTINKVGKVNYFFKEQFLKVVVCRSKTYGSTGSCRRKCHFA